MQYLLVENKQIVHLGPIDYRPRFIQSELDDLEVDYNLPVAEIGYIKINDSLELFPIGSMISPEYNPLYETLAGPFWSYKDDEAHATYFKLTLSIDSVKENLKGLAAKTRKSKELEGFTFTLQGKDVFISTAREDRNMLVGVSIPEGETISWKFGQSGFVNISQKDVNDIIEYRTRYIQTQFDKEYAIHNLIEETKTLAELKQIVIVEPKV
jgi:hypothetical protein